MEIAAYILSCAERKRTREQTIANLAATDWGAAPSVHLDRSANGSPRDRQTENARSLLEHGIAEESEFILFLEDDLEFNRWLRHNLERWRPLRESVPGGHFFASLYNPNVGALEICREHAWFAADPECVYGSQAFLLSRDTAKHIVEHWHEVAGMQDIKMSRLAARVCRIYYHLPSLVQHLGEQSVWGGHYHYTPDFDPHWRQRDPMEEIYTPEFFASLENGSLASARIIVPMLLEFLRPNTIVDVGCATGAWLAAFREAGIEDVWGVDGDRVDRAGLLFPAERFLVRDLRRPWTADVRAGLAVSLEMAEHLPPECADDFIDSLVRCAPVVLFSAAVPGQGGYGHYNEQWPEYWAARFERHGYVPIDCLRRRIWNNPAVPFWYRQNILLFADRALVESDPALRARYEASREAPLSIVHPDLYRMRALPGNS